MAHTEYNSIYGAPCTVCVESPVVPCGKQIEISKNRWSFFVKTHYSNDTWRIACLFFHWKFKVTRSWGEVERAPRSQGEVERAPRSQGVRRIALEDCG